MLRNWAVGCFNDASGVTRAIPSLWAGGRVMSRAEIPEGDCNGEEYHSDDRHQRSVLRRNGAAEHAHAGIERREAEGNNPAQEKLHYAAVNRKRVAAEGHH